MTISIRTLIAEHGGVFRARGGALHGVTDGPRPVRYAGRGESMNLAGWDIVTATRPDFICIGVQKCASTWLQDILASHPQVVLHGGDDLDFFSYRYERGMQWYLRSLPAACAGVRVGEISRSYFHEPAVPARLRSHVPGARLLVCLRDPVERAISNHRHEIRVGHLTGADLSLETGLTNNPMYILQGRYATHLSRWYEHFPRDQILVVLHDDIVANPGAVIERVYRFIGIDPAHCPPALNRKSNASHVIRHRGVERVRRRLRHMVAGAGFDPLWRAGQQLGMQSLYRRINRQASEAVVPPVNEVTRQRLRELFRGEVERLERLLERSLPGWH